MGYARIACGVLVAIATATATAAQTRHDPGEIHGLELGLNAKTMTTDDWGELDCGSNGGPPRQELDTWADFRKCRPEASGLHEVAGRFDDEDEYIAKATGDPLYASQHTETGIHRGPSGGSCRLSSTMEAFCAAFAS